MSKLVCGKRPDVISTLIMPDTKVKIVDYSAYEAVFDWPLQMAGVSTAVSALERRYWLTLRYRREAER